MKKPDICRRESIFEGSKALLIDSYVMLCDGSYYLIDWGLSHTITGHPFFLPSSVHVLTQAFEHRSFCIILHLLEQ